jgi:type IV pilus assembly protein PilP
MNAWQPTTRSVLSSLAIVSILVHLVGCADNGSDDIVSWMAEQRSVAQPKIETIQPPASFTPQTYLWQEAVSPFSDSRIVSALRAESNVTAASRLLEAEMKRPREPLEEFPLDAFTMVGLLDQRGRRVALVRVNGLLHQVRVGMRIGQNFGKITSISPNQIVLREIVQDAAGEWIERTATLQLQEGTGP